jgi:hypothetical protein
MGLYWTAFSYLVSLGLCFLLWYFVPNGALFLLACLPFWYHRMKTGKWQYVFILIGFIFIASVVFALPYYAEMIQTASTIWRLYQNIYPHGFMFSWIQYVPAFFWTALSWTVSLLLFFKFAQWIVEQWKKKQTRYGVMTFWSHCFSVVFIFYVLISLIPSLAFNVDLLSWFRSNEYLSLFYDIFFAWLPFVCTLFIIDYSLLKVKKEFGL